MLNLMSSFNFCIEFIYPGHGFYELSRMLIRKNVNDDVIKDSPIDGLFVLSGLNLVKCKGFLSPRTKNN